MLLEYQVRTIFIDIDLFYFNSNLLISAMFTFDVLFFSNTIEPYSLVVLETNDLLRIIREHGLTMV